jgi:hypothetical protein
MNFRKEPQSRPEQADKPDRQFNAFGKDTQKETHMKTTKLLTVIVILQGLILMGQWLGTPSVLSPAQAQIPDAGAQRMQIVRELEALNAKTDKMLSLLDSGKLQVHVVDNKPAAPARK